MHGFNTRCIMENKKVRKNYIFPLFLLRAYLT